MIHLKTIFSFIFIFTLSCSSLFSQRLEIKASESNSQEKDTTVSVPLEFGNTLDYMLHSWVVLRADTSNCHSSEVPPLASDSILKLRLSKMPCLMEMPYNATVRSFIDLYTIKKRHQVEVMMGMSTYYFPIFEQVLGANNLPLELKYLPIIESALNATAVSRAGAAGLWQFMIATGRMYGLEISSLVDERLSPIKATNAAARFLKDLYSIYGDWHLVIAAYNCGPGNVNKAIRRAGGKRDYWAIYPFLPKETRGYVPIFIAANYAMHYAPQHNMCPAIVNMPVIVDTVMVHERIHLEQIAAVLNLPIEEVRLLNPQYRKDIIPGNIKPYSLCLPLNNANTFIARYNEVIAYKADELINTRRSEIEILQVPTPLASSGSERVSYHKVKRGQNLGYIAAKYGVSVAKLKKWNHIRGSRVQAGDRLKILK
jgi:membrane-bound lytic murein transglycosylase D